MTPRDLSKKGDFSSTEIPGEKLSSEHCSNFEKCVTKEELFDGMMSSRRGKTPGVMDYLCLSFMFIGKVLVDPLYDMYMAALARGYLNLSEKRVQLP